ncbi:MAG: TetR/AcrR family transcriptional regulator [Actinomycetota bacterium]|nr:TetR/AcrR family transcriptional regulator [Actinomycetota bacterium]
MLSYRDRRRAAVVKEIKDTALGRLASDGPEALSLRAIARDMGLSVQSLYHYFASRDHLIAELVEDGHNGLADALEAARDAHPVSARRDRLIATSWAYRDWSVHHRREFQLIYGTPIPDYQAPPSPSDTPVPAAARIGTVFHSVVFAGWSEEQLQAMPDEHVDSALHAELVAAQQKFASPGSVLPPAALHRFIRWWGQLHGLITLELFGHLHWLAQDPGKIYRATVLQLADEIEAISSAAATRAR